MLARQLALLQRYPDGVFILDFYCLLLNFLSLDFLYIVVETKRHFALALEF